MLMSGRRPESHVVGLHEASASDDESEQGTSTPMDASVLRIALVC